MSNHEWELIFFISFVLFYFIFLIIEVSQFKLSCFRNERIKLGDCETGGAYLVCLWVLSIYKGCSQNVKAI